MYYWSESRHRSTPLLQSLNVHNISRSVDLITTSLLHNILNRFCIDHNFNFLKACISEDHHNEIKCKMFNNGDDVTVDSIRNLLKYKSDNNSSLLRQHFKYFLYDFISFIY